MTHRLYCVLFLTTMVASAAAQYDFELQTPCVAFPAPCGAAGDPEGISWNGGAALGAGLATVNSLAVGGFPTSGAQYAWITGSGPVSVAAGGPAPRPALPPATEVCIPIPSGATSVRFDWEFFCAESPNNLAFNDGASIDVVDAAGNTILALVYADTFTPRGSANAVSTCAIGSGIEMAPDGPQIAVATLPALPTGAYLSAMAWNGGDNSGFSALVLDRIAFLGVPAQPVAPTENCAVAVASASALASCPSNAHTDPSAALDLPFSNGFFSLCGSESVDLELGVTVIDGPGPDIQIDEVNANIAECYRVQVSPDGVFFFEVPGPYAACTTGPPVWAGDAAIDIAGVIPPPFLNEVDFVRIIGASGSNSGSSPGPDIDAVIAINYQPPAVGTAVRPYADAVVAFDPGAVTSTPFTVAAEATGAPDAYHSETWDAAAGWQTTWHGFVSLGAGAVLDLLFSRHYVTDGPGADVIVHEYFSPEGDQFDVSASDDGYHWHPLIPLGNVSPVHGNGAVRTTNMRAFDLQGSGLARADYVRVVSTSQAVAGATPGPEIDAVEAIHWSTKTPRLSGSTVLPLGGTTILTLALATPGAVAATLPSLSPPLPAGAGTLLPGGVAEFRLPIADPLLQFVALDPAAAALVTGAVGMVLPIGIHHTLIAVPPTPSLAGLDVTWQSVVIPAGSMPAAVSNILRTTVQ